MRKPLSNAQWGLVKDLFDPAFRPGRPARISRRLMAEAMRHQLRSGCRWRDPPGRYGDWASVWQQFRRWLDKAATLMVDHMPYERQISDPEEVNDAALRAGLFTACADIRAFVVLYHTGP